MMESRLTPEEVRANLREVRERLAEAARASGREPEAVQLMAVTKTVPPELVNVAWEEGVRLFGENRAQELLEKAASYAFGPECIHFIGTLQTNKVRQILDKVSCVQSVNSLRLAQELQRRAAGLGITLDVLLEVNIGREASKSGFDPVALFDAAARAREFEAVRVLGLMAIPPAAEEPHGNFRYFEKVCRLSVDIAENLYDNGFEYLSMGMSDDFEDAIAAGANMVRVGSAIFGHRPYQTTTGGFT